MRCNQILDQALSVSCTARTWDFAQRASLDAGDRGSAKDDRGVSIAKGSPFSRQQKPASNAGSSLYKAQCDAYSISYNTAAPSLPIRP